MSQLKNLIRGGKPEVIILEPGAFTLGRAPECDYLLIHPSVSTLHCELRREHGRVFVRDLGSTNGTFINDEPVKTETELLPDQIIRFGELSWRFEGTGLHVGGPKAASVPEEETLNMPVPSAISIGIDRATKAQAEAAMAAAPPVQRPCSKHARKPAIYICRNCRSEFCTECVRTRKISQGVRIYCPDCNGHCEDIGAFELKAAEQVVVRERSRNLFLCLGEVFRYPFRASGIILLVGGSLMIYAFKIVMFLAVHAGPFGIGAMILFPVLFFGYFAAYLHKIIQSSANGDSEMPDWPDLSSWWEDIGQPALNLLGVVLISFGLCLLYLISQGADASPLIWVPLLLLGLVYFPMAGLSVAMASSLLAANPLTVLVSISRVLKNYYLASLIFWAAFLMSVVMEAVVALIPSGMLALRLLILAISVPISLYLYVIEARVLGLIYYGNRDKLGWFDEEK